MARYSSISQTLAILACALGKTSFAVTLLRIVIQKWMNWLLWFIIITMNIANLLAALFVFVKCKDPRSNWDPSIVSKCWPDYVFTNYSLFVGGRFECPFLILREPDISSVLWAAGLLASTSPMDYRVESPDEEKRKDGRCLCDESGYFVRPLTTVTKTNTKLRQVPVQQRSLKQLTS